MVYSLDLLLIVPPCRQSTESSSHQHVAGVRRYHLFVDSPGFLPPLRTIERVGDLLAAARSYLLGIRPRSEPCHCVLARCDPGLPVAMGSKLQASPPEIIAGVALEIALPHS